MPSPFPGMDPFLEDHWGDVHTSLTTYARNEIRPQLPVGLCVRVEESVGLEVGEDAEELTHIRPDLLVSEPWSSSESSTSSAVPRLIVADEPLFVSFPREPQTLRRILIHDKNGEVLVTAIEFFVPDIKYGKARKHFRQRQRDLVAGGVNVVEIDLVRAGGWTVYPEEEYYPASHAEPYRIVVVRVAREWGFECYPAGIRDRLPRIRVPLRRSDPDAVLDLQKLVDLAWENGGYSNIDYAKERLPGFEDADRQWIRDQLALQGIARTL